MRFLILLFTLCLSCYATPRLVPDYVVAKSRSGQFTVRAAAGSIREREVNAPKMPMAGSWAFALQPPLPKPGAASGFVDLEPALLAIGCERLKEAMLFELGAPDLWKGHIDVMINSALPEGDEPFLVATIRPGGWSYSLEVPKSAKPDRLLRALVHVMLLEMANRNAGPETAEIPLWLVEGMTAHLRAFNLPTFLVQENKTMLGNRIKLDALDVVRTHLRNEQALSFQALSWPDTEQADGRTPEIYKDCAQLLVYELLHFKHGRHEMAAFILQLATHRNWQLTFLGAFRSQFTKLLDVEKWWALTCVSFSGNQVVQKWSPEESRKHLQDLLDVPVEVHLAADRLPTAAAITLQEVVQNWDRASETSALERTISGLQILHWHCAPELDALALHYEKALNDYLQQRDHPKILHTPNALRIPALKKNLCRELDKLDAQREQLSKQQIAAKAAVTNTQKFAAEKR
jgi:hypothetical protein